MRKFLFVLLCGFMFASCGQKGGNGDPSGENGKGKGKKSDLVEVKMGSIRNYLEEIGEITPRTIVNVKFNFSGKIDWIYKEEGDKCVAGEKLAKVFPDINQIQTINSAQLAYERALASLQKLSNEMAEVDELYKQGMASQTKYDDAVNALKIGLSELRMAKTEMDSIEGGSSVENKKGVNVVAPISGTIISRLVDIGDYVIASSSYQTGTVLFKIADISDVLVEAKINEVDILNIHDNADVEFTIDALADQTFSGKVYRVFPTPVVENNVKKYMVQIAIPSGLPKTIKPGMSVKIKVLTVSKDNVPVLPIGSVIRDSDQKKDYVLIPSSKVAGKFEKQYITIGAWDNDQIEIKTGLKPGDKAVKSPFEIDDTLIVSDESTNQQKTQQGQGGSGGHAPGMGH